MVFSLFLKRHPILSGLITFFIGLTVLLVLIEGAYACLLSYRTHKEGVIKVVRNPKMFTSDPWLGKTYNEGKFTWSFLRKDVLVHESVSTIDGVRKRVTPRSVRGADSKFILYFGGSFTFGYGVNDHETIPAYIEENAADYEPYNYGFDGAGPQRMLAHLQRDAFQSEIKQSSGILLYSFIDEHISRVVNTMQTRAHWGKSIPQYGLKEGEIARLEGYATTQAFRTKLYDLLSKSYFIKYTRIDFPRFRKKDLFLTAKIIEASKEKFSELFGSDEFYVIFYPGSHYAHQMKPLLDEAGIKYFNYYDLFNKNEEKWSLPYDPHPSPLAYETIAREIVKDLGLA